MNVLELFAGAGGGILGHHLLGHRTVCAVEYDSYAASVLMQRQNDGILPPFPIWDDVRTFDGKPWRGIVDCVSGGFPCQDISAAGSGSGIDGERSGLWREMARIVREVRPSFVFVENSPMLVSRGLAVVLGDLAEMGFNAEWFRISAAECGAPHGRDRIWLLGSNANGKRWRNLRRNRSESRERILEFEGLVSSDGGWNGWDAGPEEKAKVLGMADGVAGELDGIRCAGNGQVPIVAATAFQELMKRFDQ